MCGDNAVMKRMADKEIVTLEEIRLSDEAKSNEKFCSYLQYTYL